MKTCAEKFFEVLFYFCMIEFIWDGLSGRNIDLYRGLFNLSAALSDPKSLLIQKAGWFSCLCLPLFSCGCASYRYSC